MMTQRMMWALLGAIAVAPLPQLAYAGSTVPQSCAKAKLTAAGKKAAARLKCYSSAATKSLPVDQACLDKASAGFTKVFPKADAKGVCEGTLDAVEFSVDHCAEVAAGLFMSGGKCQSSKLKAMGGAAAAELICYAGAASKGLPTGGANPDPKFTACIAKNQAKLEAAWVKADGSAPCEVTIASAEAALSNNCIQPVSSQLPPVAVACGNGIVDASLNETCDDGNTVNGDACPSNCHIDSCTVNNAISQSVSVNLTAPAGVTVGALTMLLDYPEGQVRLPVTSPGGSVLDTPNDLTYALKDALLDGSLSDGIPANAAGPMLQVSFHGCVGQGLPVASSYTCTILDAADESGTTIAASSLSCNVTIP